MTSCEEYLYNHLFTCLLVPYKYKQNIEQAREGVLAKVQRIRGILANIEISIIAGELKESAAASKQIRLEHHLVTLVRVHGMLSCILMSMQVSAAGFANNFVHTNVSEIKTLTGLEHYQVLTHLIPRLLRQKDIHTCIYVVAIHAHPPLHPQRT